MPELAEVEFYRKRWSVGHRARILAVQVHRAARIFRGQDAEVIVGALSGSQLLDSGAAAKQMLFKFSGQSWLGLHLGMTGELRVEPPAYAAQKHDHFVLRQPKRSLVFTDPRMFGRLLFHQGPAAPAWWTEIAPAVLSPAFTRQAVADFLQRRARTPIKAVLLMQEQFPGVGNWMADEILWRAAIHPRRLSASLTPDEVRRVWRECRQVCRMALRVIAGHSGKLPPDLNAHIPDQWLFKHRWADGGRCPRTGVSLIREEIGGRTSCWSPARQSL